MEVCPCGSEQPFQDCCRPYLDGLDDAPTAEALMRSRYSAYVTTNIGYLHQTTHDSQREQFNREQSEAWSKRADWHSLEILSAHKGGPDDTDGFVEFVARYREKGNMRQHHEVAEFKKEDGKWFFVDGRAPAPMQSVRQGPKIGRNQPCPCGSGKKYKKCCAS